MTLTRLGVDFLIDFIKHKNGFNIFDISVCGLMSKLHSQTPSVGLPVEEGEREEQHTAPRVWSICNRFSVLTLPWPPSLTAPPPPPHTTAIIMMLTAAACAAV
jgi:hypothetical protein